jgi:hypothetical protein
MWHALVDPPRRIRPIEVGDVVKSSQGTSIGEVQGLMLDLTSDCTYAVLAADEVLDEGDTLYAVPEEAFNQLEADFAWELNLDTDESAEGEVQKILVLR